MSMFRKTGLIFCFWMLCAPVCLAQEQYIITDLGEIREPPFYRKIINKTITVRLLERMNTVMPSAQHQIVQSPMI
jgi:hypothetical protein